MKKLAILLVVVFVAGLIATSCKTAEKCPAVYGAKSKKYSRSY